MSPADDLALTGTDLLVFADDLRSAVIDDHLVVFAPTTRRGVVLNASAALVFIAFDEIRPLSAVIDQIATDTGLGRPQVEPDVIATTALLVSDGLLRLVPRGTGDAEAPSSAGHSDDSSQPAPVPQPGPTRAVVGDSPAGSWLFERRLSLPYGSAVVRADDPAAANLLARLLTDVPRADPDPANPVSPTGPTEVDRSVVVRADSSGHWPLSVAADGLVPEAFPSSELATAYALLHLDGVAIDGASAAIVLHAGAVERGGRAVVLAGESGTGKSTLTAALIEAGFAYLTDEVTVVEPGTHEVRPYPKALDLSAASVAQLTPPVATMDIGVHKVKVLASSLGQVSRGGHAALVVLLKGSSDDSVRSGPVVPELLSPVDAMVGLLPSTFEVSIADPARFADLAVLCEEVPVMRLPRAPLDAMVSAVETLFDQRSLSARC